MRIARCGSYLLAAQRPDIVAQLFANDPARSKGKRPGRKESGLNSQSRQAMIAKIEGLGDAAPSSPAAPPAAAPPATNSLAEFPLLATSGHVSALDALKKSLQTKSSSYAAAVVLETVPEVAAATHEVPEAAEVAVVPEAADGTEVAVVPEVESDTPPATPAVAPTPSWADMAEEETSV